MRRIVWLASYPKSGNTWFRAFLASLLDEADNPADINRLSGGPIFSARSVFDRTTGLQSSDLLPHEIEALRPAVYREMAAHASRTLFIKAHDAYTYLEDGSPLYPPDVTIGAIYLVRNPLDIAPSFANHSNCDISRIIRDMANPRDAFCGGPGELANQLRQHLLGWSGHVRSWLNAREMEVLFIRYEEMKGRPLETFRKALRFAGLEHGDDEILAALDACAFNKLRAQEEERGFREKGAKVARFFRKGEVGSWQDSLSLEQARTLIAGHGEMMRRFGYLGEANELRFIEDIPTASRGQILDRLRVALERRSYHYKLHGLRLSLPFAFDALNESPDGEEKDADIRCTLGEIEEGDEEWHHRGITTLARPGLCRLSVAGVARFQIRNGADIHIEVSPGAELAAVRLFLLNTVMGIALMQRGVLPLWGSCVVHQGRAFALLGHSSVGKSFLAAGLEQRGFRVLNDNLCPITDDDTPSVMPGYPFLMLWERGLKMLERKTDGLAPVRQGLGKYITPLSHPPVEEPIPLGGVYLLSTHNRDSCALEPVTGFKKAFRILDHTYNEPLMKGMGLLQQQHRIAGRIASQVPVKRYTYLDSREWVERSIDNLERDILATAE